MKKAFTLVELLGVIIILAVIALISLPIIDNTINQSRQNALERTIENIEDAAYRYSVEYDLGYPLEQQILQLSELINKGFISNEDHINPVTDEELNGCVLYRWDETYKQYKFEYADPCEIRETIPTMTLVYNEDYINENGWINRNVMVNLNGTGSKYYYCVSDAECEPVIEENKSNGTQILTTEGTNYVCAKAVNDYGESDVVCTSALKIDKTPPTMGSITVNGNKGSNNWYISDVNIDITDGTDSMSGYDKTISSATSITRNTLGTMVYVVANDLAGNTVTSAFNIKVDKNYPTLNAKSGDVTVMQGDNNPISNYFTASYSISGGEISCNPSNTSSLMPGNRVVICSAIGGNGLSSEASKSIKVNTTSLVGLLYSQYGSGTPGTEGLKQDSSNPDVYYFTGSATYNYLWYGGFLWRVLEFDVSKRTVTLVSNEALTYIYPNATVWTTKEAYESSWINRWLQEEFYAKLSTDVKNHILDSTYNLGPTGDVTSVQTVQKVGLLDEDQFNKYGISAIGANGNFYLGSVYDTTKFIYINGYWLSTVSSGYSYSYGVKPVITISDITITNGTGSSSDNYRTNYKSATTNDVQIGEYINIPTTGTYCGTDNLCTFRVVSKEDNKIKVIYQGTIGTSVYGPSSTISLNHDVYTLLNMFKETIDSKYMVQENSVFYIGDYPFTAIDYKEVQDEILEANIGLPVVGDLFTGYLSNNYWTMNRYSSSDVRYGGRSTLANYGDPSDSIGVRAVVYLKSGTSALTFTGGEGTIENPYTLS